MSALNNILQKLFFPKKQTTTLPAPNDESDSFVLGKDFDFDSIPPCPACKSSQVAVFIYGKPRLSRVIVEGFESGKFISGGCMIRETAPKWHCYDCNKDFGRLL